MTASRPQPEAEAGWAPTDDGGRLYYEVDGDLAAGTALLLVRPLGGTIVLWGTFRERLAVGRCVIVFDARGTGRSSAAPLRTTTRSMAADARRVLAHLGVARADVFGISLGGMVATRLAADASPLVARLVLASTPLRGTTMTRTGLGRLVASARCLALRAPDAEACLVRQILSDRFRANAAETARVEALVRAMPSTRAALLKHIAAAALHDGSDATGRIVAPTLVLAGGADAVLDPAFQASFAARIAGAIFEQLPDVGHDLTLEAPAATATRVLAFLRGR